MHLLISSSSFAYNPLLSVSPLKITKFHHRFSIQFSLSNTEITMQEEILYDYSPFLRIYKTGRVERLKGSQIAPPSLEPTTRVVSKDVVYSPELNLSCRLYLPETHINNKLPLLVYFHGGGFCIETPFSPLYHNSLNNLVMGANCVTVSVGYRRAPEHPLPAAYDDAWTALNWVASHSNGDGNEEWLNLYADFGRLVLAGDSAGANIAQQVCIRNGQDEEKGINISGMVLIHPYFWGNEAIGNEDKDLEKRKLVSAIWYFACPKSENGCDNPWINPVVHTNIGSLGCGKVLVIVAEQDVLRDRGWFYYEKLKSCGWQGEVEMMEIKQEDHVFHLEKADCENAVVMVKKIASFINQDKA